jgi:hypothetical protein
LSRVIIGEILGIQCQSQSSSAVKINKQTLSTRLVMARVFLPKSLIFWPRARHWFARLLQLDSVIARHPGQAPESPAAIISQETI